jgi:putative flippase GtrA
MSMGIRATAFGEIRRLLRFGGVGIVSLVVYSVLYAILAAATRWSAIPISTIAYSIAMVVSFVGHKYVTFRVSGNIRLQALKFIGMHCLCLLTTVVITGLVVNKLNWPYGIAILLVDVAIPALSYVMLKLIVFEETSTAASVANDRSELMPPNL